MYQYNSVKVYKSQQNKFVLLSIKTTSDFQIFTILTYIFLWLHKLLIDHVNNSYN